MHARARRHLVILSAPLLAAVLASGCTATNLDRPAPVVTTRHGGPASALAASPLAAAARAHMTQLANGIGARYSGTPAERRAEQYVRSALEASGYTVETQGFEFNEGRSANLVATKQGKSSDVIVVGAHYDAVDSADGADDNASGVGVLLAAAEAVRSVDTPYTIQFVAFGAEEADDMFGSEHYVDQLDAPARAATLAMVNLDSISAGDIPYVYGDADVLLAWTRRAASEAGQAMDTVPVRNLHDDADYVAFQRAGIPFIYFEATNWNLGDRDGFTQVDPRYGRRGAILHTRYDTLAYLDETFPGRIDERLGLYATVLTRILTEHQF